MTWTVLGSKPVLAWYTASAEDARQTCCQWPLLPQRWQVSLAVGQSWWAACGVWPHHKQVGKAWDFKAEDPSYLKGRQGALDLAELDVTLCTTSVVSSFAVLGVSWWADCSSCCIVTAYSVLRPVSKRQALFMTCARKREAKFTWGCFEKAWRCCWA